MSAALTRFDSPAADHAARNGNRAGGTQGRQQGDRASDRTGSADEWRGPEAIAAERARREGAGDSRRETGAAGLDQAAAGQGHAAGGFGEPKADDAAIAARIGHLALEVGSALAGHEDRADDAAKAVAAALARVAPEGEGAEIAQAQDPAARFFASLERLRALAGQLDGAGGAQEASAPRAGDPQALAGQAAGDPVSRQNAVRNAAQMQAGQQNGTGAHAAAMESDESLHLSLRDNPGRSGLGARPPAGIGEARVVSQATHFAPVSQAALGAGNMNALAKAFDEGAAFMRDAGQNVQARGGEARGAEMRAGGFDQTLAGNLRGEGARPAAPVKTLTIQLTPVSLGKISVAMHLSDGAMRMEITVADPRALEMVRADKDLIGNLIRKSGLSPESITIQSGDPAQAGRQSANGNGAGQNGNAFAQQGNGEAGSGRDSRRGGEGAAGSDPEGSIQHENAHGTRLSDGGDIYL